MIDLLYRYVAIGGVALASVTGAYFWGRSDGRDLEKAKYLAALDRATERAREAEAEAAPIVQEAQRQHQEALAEIVIVRRIIIREVPRYVTVEADRACPVPAGFVELHDAAAAGRVPDIPTAAGGADAPTAVTLSAVVGTVTDNYGACHQIAADLRALQAYERERQAWEAKHRR